MKFFKLDLLTLLISLFILNSCKNQGTIGLGANGNGALTGNLVDTSTIIINTIPEDSVQTSNTTGNTVPVSPLGLFRDPVFGTTESNIAMDLNLPTSSPYTVPSGTITIDSALLVLRYAPGFYGDSLASRYKINVYQLSERIFTNSAYYNTKQWKYNSSTLLGSKSFLSRTHDTVGINVYVAGGKDSIQKVPPQVRIPIDKNFINNILFNNPNVNQLGSNLVFKNAINGLYITMDKTGTTGAGGTFMMALDSGSTNTVLGTSLDIYYKAFDGTTTDTAMVTLTSTLHASQIKHTYSTAVQTELNNQTTGTRNAIYIQGTAGLRARISFPYLKNIVKTLGSDIVINRAELVITPNPGSTIPFAPLQRITMYRFDLAGQRSTLEDASSNDPRSQGPLVFGGFYATTLQDYHFVITAYISDLARGIYPDYGTFIGAADIANPSAVGISVTPQVAARTFAVGFDKTSPYRIKLNIIYTKIAK